MNDREATIQALEGLLAEVQSLHMAQTVQRSAYVVLVHHLQAKGLVHLPSLAKALRTMAESEPDADWQSGHAEFADALELLQNLPSKQSKAAGQTGR